MKNIFFITALISISIVSCKKSTDETAPGAILIRVKNNTADHFSYSAVANVNFGKINAGTITGYKTFTSVIAYPGARIVYAADTVYAGQFYCGTPPLPMLENGKYRLEITPDAAAPYGLEAKYIRE